MNIPIQLSSHVTLFVDAANGARPVTFSDANLQDLRTHVLNELTVTFGQKKIRATEEGEYVYPNSGIVESKVHRVLREPTSFAPAFKDEVKKLVEELSAAIPGDGVLVLDARYCDKSSFAAENMFSDYLYVYARLVKKDA